jgi:ATP-dependent RNA helicase RhlE
MISFEDLNLNKPLLNALDDLGYVYPTPIQEKVFPVVMSGKNVTGIAQTGTGKTLAYLLPLLRQLKYSEQIQPRILIVVPTRELVIQVLGEIEKLSKYMTVRFAGVYGGSNMSSQKELVYKGMDILVATPGRLLDLNLNGVLRLKFVQKLVIDEADEMLSLGFRSQLMHVMDLLPAKRQNLLFSATMNGEVEKLIREYILDPQKIEISPQGTPVDRIIQKGIPVPNFHTKANLLEHLLGDKTTFSKVLVFVKSRKAADDLFSEMSSRSTIELGIIHSNKSQPQRFKAIKKFEEGETSVLIATDIIARGLDLQAVSHVINFDVPDTPGDYIHRIGRTGRADAAGTSITFVSEAEEEYLAAIEMHLKKALDMEPLPKAVKVSVVLKDDEKPPQRGKGSLRAQGLKETKGAFHEKKDKNKKVNLGGPGVRYAKKGSVRSAKKKKRY